jgi:hypothetical protein
MLRQSIVLALTGLGRWSTRCTGLTRFLTSPFVWRHSDGCDARTLVITIMAMAAVAAYVPARRASQVDLWWP